MKHAPCPTVCAACQSKIKTLAMTGSSSILHVCTHTGAAAEVTVVMAHAQRCTIARWDLHGPMPPARAQRFVQETLALVAAQAQIAAANAG